VFTGGFAFALFPFMRYGGMRVHVANYMRDGMHGSKIEYPR